MTALQDSFRGRTAGGSHRGGGQQSDICHPKVLTSHPGVLQADLPECPWKIRTEDSMTLQRQIEDGRPLAELRGTVRKYGAVTALAGVDFAVQPGEVVAL